MEEFEEIKKSNRLSDTVIDVMHLIYSFRERHNVKKRSRFIWLMIAYK